MRYFLWIICAIILIGIVYIFHFVQEDSRELDFFVSIIGTSFTVLGIVITLDQIRQTRTKTEETQKAVEETKNRMQSIAKAFSIADAIRLAEGTEVYLRNQCSGESLIKLQEFSQILISINDEDMKYDDSDMSKTLTRQMQQIKVAINTLNKPKVNPRDIDWNTIITHVEESKNILIAQLSKMNKTL